MCIKSLRLSPMLLTSSSVRPSTYGTIVLLCLLKTWESRLSRSIKSAFGLKKNSLKMCKAHFSNILGNIEVWHFSNFGELQATSVQIVQIWGKRVQLSQLQKRCRAEFDRLIVHRFFHSYHLMMTDFQAHAKNP